MTHGDLIRYFASIINYIILFSSLKTNRKTAATSALIIIQNTLTWSASKHRIYPLRCHNINPLVSYQFKTIKIPRPLLNPIKTALISFFFLNSQSLFKKISVNNPGSINHIDCQYNQARVKKKDAFIVSRRGTRFRVEDFHRK